MGNIGAVQARLVQDELTLKQEITLLQEELKRDQDPGRMHLIQEMISVSNMRSLHSAVILMYKSTYCRTCWVRCPVFARRLQNQKQ